MPDFVIRVKYKDHEKILPFEGKNVHALRTQLGRTVLHNTDKDNVRTPVKEGAVKAYINGELADDGDVVGLGETLEFAENPPDKK
jgi:hypothetical protein